MPVLTGKENMESSQCMGFLYHESIFYSYGPDPLIYLINIYFESILGQRLWKNQESHRKQHVVFSLEELQSSGRREDKKTRDVQTVVLVRMWGKTRPMAQEGLRISLGGSEVTS